MSRIKSCFDELRTDRRKALVPYVTAGDPSPEVTVPLMHEMVKAGADIIELGVPFSDPMADGSVIQKASERALKHNVSLKDVLVMVQRFREVDDKTPVILMGYLNPIEVMGVETFVKAAGRAGVDGVLTVDLPPEEADELLVALQGQQCDPIFLLSPTTNEARVSKICAAASGFVYYVAVKGITGAGNLDVAAVEEKVAQIRRQTDLPVGVGFGIKDAASAAAVSKIADAVIVGSALVRKVEESDGQSDHLISDISGLLGEMRQAMDA